MALYPLKAGENVRVQTSVPGMLNILKYLVQQSWAAPIAAHADHILEAETIPVLGGVFTASDGLNGVAQALKVTIGGVAADVKAVDIAIVGTDADDQALSENFLCTVNTLGVIQGTSLFKTVTSITSPAQDGAGVTMKVGTADDDDAVLPVETIPAAGLVYKIGVIAHQPDVCRALTITLGGTAASINGATTPLVIDGTDSKGVALSENFTVTEDTAETVQGSKAFKTVRRIAIGAQDGAGVTLTVGVNDKLGLNTLLPVNTVLYATLGGSKESTAPAVTVSTTEISANTIDLNSALNATAVKAVYVA